MFFLSLLSDFAVEFPQRAARAALLYLLGLNLTLHLGCGTDVQILLVG